MFVHPPICPSPPGPCKVMGCRLPQRTPEEAESACKEVESACKEAESAYEEAERALEETGRPVVGPESEEGLSGIWKRHRF